MGQTIDIADGVYFQLPAEAYHSVPALSASGIKNLLISGPDFWYRTPWLNPDYVDEDSEARKIGRAYHKRILEGREAFCAAYAETFTAPTCALKTIEDMADALSKVAISLPSKAKKADYLEAVRTNCPDELIFDDLREKHEARHAGKELLSHDLIAKIEMSAAMIESHPENRKLVTSGYPELTIIWSRDGLRFKARLDYVKPRAFSDLKTFANFLNKPIDAAIYSAMASGKIHIHLTHYMRALDAAKTLPIFGDPDPVWLKEFLACEQHGCYVLFQAKGVAPLTRAKKFNRGSIWSCAEAAIEQAISKYREYSDHFVILPWVDLEPIGELIDDHYPVYTTEL